MKVLLVNTSEHRGGAAIACGRLMQALRRSGVDARMLVAVNDDSDAIGYCDTPYKRWLYKWAFLWERVEIFTQNGLSRANLFAVSTADTGQNITSHPAVQEADIIHLHWVNQGFLSLSALQQILSLGKPVVWTMHDMWPTTGICHHARTCDRYTDSCGQCMFLNSTHDHDLSHRTFVRKQGIYSTAPLHFVTCSAWLRNLTERSALLKSSDTVCNIPNPIDTQYFVPGDKSDARRTLRLPEDKKLILFGAVNAADKRKGIDYFIDTLRILHDRNDSLSKKIELVVFGSTAHMAMESLPYRCTSMGYITSPETMRDIYRAADVYVTPSLEENLPNTIMEAMACGTPCVGFDIGGIPEMIDAANGYVAQYKDAADMAHGIANVLDDDNYPSKSKAAREKVITEYGEKAVASRYISLYRSLLDK